MSITNNTGQLVRISVFLISLLLMPFTAIAASIVDINRANEATMIENWKGIGETKARAIVAYRKKNGPFKSIDDLANVKGIGEGIINNNRKLMSTTRGLSKPSGKSASTTSKSSTKKTTAKATDSKSKTASGKTSTAKTAKKDNKPAKKSTAKSKSTDKPKSTSKSKSSTGKSSSTSKSKKSSSKSKKSDKKTSSKKKKKPAS